MQEELKEFLEKHCESLGISHYGITPLGRPLSFDFYQSWVGEGLHGDMDYLARHAPIKENPKNQWPRAESALIFAMPYYPHPAASTDFPLRQARLSLYARGLDYHLWFQDRMETLATRLRELFPREEFICFTDSSPVLERDLARKAGLGWVGKNTCLIHPQKGSLFFIGEIYTSVKVTLEAKPVHDFCGTCTRCLDICPTQALVEPRKLDARKCISYLTIETKSPPPESLRSSIGDWLFGCDLCQTVCPWNQKAFKNQLSVASQENLNRDQEELLLLDLRYLLTSSGKKLGRDFAGTALSRAGSFGLKKNALIVAANRGLKILEPEVKSLLEHPRLGELAAWTLRQWEL
jgi:epoxyqueuosine reductase